VTTEITDDAIVTGIIPYGEADLVVKLFTREHGRRTAFARAARKSKKRFGGSLTAFATGTAVLRTRRGRDLPLLASFEAGPALFGLAEPEVYGRAAYIVELTDRLLPEAEPETTVYAWLSAALEHLARLGADPRLLRAYELQLLLATGYLPDLDTASDLEDEPPVAIDPASGALVAEPGEGALPFGPEVRSATRALLDAQPTALPDLDEPTLRAVGRLFAVHLRRMEIRDLKSVAFLRSLSR
jgi:DNA repair protein RecO (recombination protein O)